MTDSLVPEGTSVSVGAGERAYPVMIGTGLVGSLPELLARGSAARRFAVISDDNVAPLHSEALVEGLRSAGLEATLLTFPAGEQSKTRKRWSILTDEMLEAGFGRDSSVVAVGGGVTTDLGGFVAATFMRGVPVVQMPTSYLAMVDASVGGKTGVDVRQGKNLIGAFHPPEMVVIDPTVLETLPQEERAEGLVEALKHGAILDEAYFEELLDVSDSLLAAQPHAAVAAVRRSVELKAGVVTEDELESGYRQILNFGHTVGHAIEAASDYALGHGTAIALGMATEARVGEALGVTAPGSADRIERAVQRLLGTHRPDLDLDRVVSYLSADKKTRHGRPRYVLIREIGRVDPGDGWTHEVSEALVIDVLSGL